MAAKIIDGKALARAICQQLEHTIKDFVHQSGRPPGLAVVCVGEDPASKIYVRNKHKKSRELGISSWAHDLPAAAQEEDVMALVRRLNQDPGVDGILVQLPLPGHIRADRVIAAIDPDKDVDGLHPCNMGKVLLGSPRLLPCTPAGIMELIHSTKCQIQGRRAVVVGRSNIVGKPIAQLLLQEHATVTMCHSRTEHLAAECLAADILVVAVGRKHFVGGDWIKPGAVVIDVGMNRVENDWYGDVDFSRAQARAAFITPVPGGVGPMT
ncbi:bifunctional methylenetetrahydrofolate dehydrogenase/methenyltetrahydrofolate cyclohydrolase FolD, partial [candidate division FCPU426 bacterium]|nr:bifunctional methylenetetrahydrofolate dehydrogenase/methenyltetrahydrofolate cyclohydrolase FolD [candidate division FCPU426 bacterium]